MKVITRTWQRGLVGKLIVGLAGITACCCASSFVAVLSPSRPQPSAQPTAPALALAAVTFAAPTAAPTASPAPTEAPTAIPTDVPTAAPTDPPTPEPTAAPTTPAAPIVTAADQVNVRAGPGTAYATIGQLAAGQAAPITGKSADGTWWQIELAGAPGWVRADIVAAAGPLEAVASVEAPALPATAAAPPTTEPAAAAPTVEAPPTAIAPAPEQIVPTFSDGQGLPNSEVSPPWWPCREGQVKANNNSGIYHVPGGQSYARTFKDVTCYNTGEEAEGAGFRQAQR